MDNESVADAMNRGFFLAPDLVGEGDVDPLLEQAVRNVEEEADEAEEAVQARKVAEALKVAETAEETEAEATPVRADDGFRAIVANLVLLFGRKYVAVIGGAPRTGVVGEWLQGTSVPTDDRMSRLRLTFRVTQLLRTRCDDAAVRHWFFSKNQLLDGAVPVAAVVLQPTSTVEDQLLAAAAAVA